MENTFDVNREGVYLLGQIILEYKPNQSDSSRGHPTDTDGVGGAPNSGDGSAEGPRLFNPEATEFCPAGNLGPPKVYIYGASHYEITAGQPPVATDLPFTAPPYFATSPQTGRAYAGPTPQQPPRADCFPSHLNPIPIPNEHLCHPNANSSSGPIPIPNPMQDNRNSSGGTAAGTNTGINSPGGPHHATESLFPYIQVHYLNQNQPQNFHGIANANGNSYLAHDPQQGQQNNFYDYQVIPNESCSFNPHLNDLREYGNGNQDGGFLTSKPANSAETGFNQNQYGQQVDFPPTDTSQEQAGDHLGLNKDQSNKMESLEMPDGKRGGPSELGYGEPPDTIAPGSLSGENWNCLNPFASEFYPVNLTSSSSPVCPDSTTGEKETTEAIWNGEGGDFETSPGLTSSDPGSDEKGEEAKQDKNEKTELESELN